LGGWPGGGISNLGTAVLSNSTVSGNTATSDGGGIYNRGTLILNNGTVSGNTGRPAGGIHNSDAYGGAVTLRNSILAGNTTDTFGPDCSGTLGSAGYNLVGDTADCNFSGSTGDLVNIDARLFRLVGVPGVHPLLPGSPAIDAGNPAGCTDHQGNPLTTDQRGTARPLDGDGDGDAICDMGAYEVDPAHPVSQVFTPVCIRYYCPDFFDDFSDPASGWAVVDDTYVRSEYLDGEYRVLTKQAGYFYLFSAPTCDRRSYVVEADARWVGSPGSGYGLMFGLIGDFEEFYLFDINTDYKRFRLLRADPTDWTVVVPITDAPAIKGGTASNHLKVTRDGDQITLEVNGTVLGTWTEGSITGLTGSGVVSSPYSSEPVSDARFDNFRVTRLPGGTAAGVFAPARVSAGAPKAHRQAVPAGMEYR
jgi:predicted outer membrane repeat protein